MDAHNDNIRSVGYVNIAEPCTKLNRHERRYFQQDGWAPYHSFPLPIISSRASSDGRVFLLIAASRSPNTDPVVGPDPAFLLGPLRSSRRSPCCDSCVSFRSRESLWSIMDYRAGLKKGSQVARIFQTRTAGTKFTNLGGNFVDHPYNLHGFPHKITKPF